ncbi:selT selW selH seleno domain-containing protein [Rutstroemia sp. NJR-2017a WRK4]|nr:selT selW selH seleno domain-containing protein [Rutstroemia sp. NJR-2017a WRK4]
MHVVWVVRALHVFRFVVFISIAGAGAGAGALRFGMGVGSKRDEEGKMEGGDSTQLLSTFSTDIGEVALQPSTGGTFVVTLYHAGKEGVKNENGEVNIQTHVIWDRKVEGGFPETKELKKRVRNIIDPTRDLGHVDGKKSDQSIPATTSTTTESSSAPSQPATQTQEPKEVLNSRGKIVIESEEGGFGYCRPGDEDCGF